MPLRPFSLRLDTQVRLYAPRPKFLRAAWPEPSANEQPSDTNTDGDDLGGRCGRLPDDHGTNSPGPDGAQPIICL
jgi:hypothetical protein